MDLHPSDQLCNFRAFKTLEETSAPTTETGLALAAADSVDMDTQGLARPESELPSRSRCMITAMLGPDFNDLYGGLLKTT